VTSAQTAHGKAILVTGAAGLVGAEVVDRLSKHRPVIATTHRNPRIVRNDGSDVAAVAYTPGSDARVRQLAVDVRLSDFGLQADLLESLSGEVGGIVHCAATVALDAAEQDYQDMNVTATANTVELAQRWDVPLVHVSTAYVCGRRDGRILEDELDAGQEFSNGYEHSKLRAEKLVRSAPGLRWSVVRPAIVAGSADSGAVRDYKNLYTLVKLIVEGKLRRLPGRYDATLSLVPVDYTADVTVAVTLRMQSDEAAIHGRTFHATGNGAISLREVSNVFAEYPSFQVATFVPAASFSIEDLDSFERDYYQRLGAQYVCYFDRVRAFDDSTTRTLLGMEPPDTGQEYLRTLLDYCLEAGYLGRVLPSVEEILQEESSSPQGGAQAAGRTGTEELV
jgi:thioester reductase-like protein